MRPKRSGAAAGKPGEAEEELAKAAMEFELALKADPNNFHRRRGITETVRELKPPAKRGI